MILDKHITSINSDNHLIIDFKQLGTQHLITCWNEGIRFYMKTTNGQWMSEELDPGFLLISDEYSAQKNISAYYFMQLIPDELQDYLKPFSKGQFTLLKLFSHYPFLIDIFKHSPNLVWITVIEALNQNWHWEKVIKLLQQKREKIIAEIIHSKAKSAVKFINKIKLLEGNDYEYKLIKECLTNTDILNYFTHWENIPTHALVVVRKFPVILKTNLLYGLIDLDLTFYRQLLYFSGINHTLQDIIGMARMIDCELTDDYFMRFKTIAAVNRAHDHLVEQLNELQLSNPNTTFFPTCRLGDTDDIKQIKNSTELAIEGKYMHHCVASYADSLIEGDNFIYKVISPERATLHIKKTGHKFDIRQFKLICNKKPSDESFLMIRQWLAEMQTQFPPL